MRIPTGRIDRRAKAKSARCGVAVERSRLACPSAQIVLLAMPRSTMVDGTIGRNREAPRRRRKIQMEEDWREDGTR